MATRRSQARRFQTARRSTRRSLQAARRSTRRSLQTNPLVGWLVAGALLVVLAFIVGGPAAEQGLLGSRSSPTPSASAALTIRFGQALNPDTNRAVGPARGYHAGQTFAYSVTLAQPPTTSSIFVEVQRISGQPRVVQERSVQHITAGRRTFAFTVPTDDLLAAWGDGRFEMRIFLGQETTPIAIGRFRLVAAPSATPG
ncbi:MAG TPA: hypothetical protein VIH33_07815 [Candidatus Limnocylindria bacterium]|jgi:hypothetical protein